MPMQGYERRLVLPIKRLNVWSIKRKEEANILSRRFIELYGELHFFFRYAFKILDPGKVAIKQTKVF